MDKSKIENLNPQEYTHLPHAEQHFEDHEQTDVAIRPLVWTLIAIGAIIVVSGVGLWGLFALFQHWSERAPDNQPLSHVFNVEDVRQVPQGSPELQGVPARGANPNSPAEDLIGMRQRNQKILAGLEPMRRGGQPGMPIDQAMQKALSSGMFKTGGKAQANRGGQQEQQGSQAEQQQQSPRQIGQQR